MPSPKNRVIIASAGSGKTTYLVDQALTFKGKKILITTYTNENFDQINSYLIQKNGCVPENITVQTWYGFLLQDGVRPYQNWKITEGRVRSIYFDAVPDELRYIPKTNSEKYFLTRGKDIYKDRVSDFVCQCNDVSQGLVVKRLEKIYDYILIDEIQDLSGYDLTFLESLLLSSINIIGVGDPRQSTFTTNNSSKNKKYKKASISEWIQAKEKSELLVIETLADCRRCNQEICNFADALFPDLPKTNSTNTVITGHDGFFFLKPEEVLEYFEKHKPVVLRHSKASKTMDLPAVNIGVSKGRTYARVLIFPTKPMKQYLKDKDLSKIKDKTRFYVAVTRAQYSVAFVL